MAFYEKCFPTFVRNPKEPEFMQLRQRRKSISLYIVKLKELYKISTIY